MLFSADSLTKSTTALVEEDRATLHDPAKDLVPVWGGTMFFNVLIQRDRVGATEA